ncbi:MAG: HNH endonuclease [FCB group bacterium]|nr:HNH endonuclease [FCB group bacterium]
MTQSQYDGKPKQERGKSASYQNLYSYKWRKYSERRLIQYPICVHCHEAGHIRKAEVTDHIQPHKGSRHLFWKYKNHQSLCKRCHDKKTSTEGAFGK